MLLWLFVIRRAFFNMAVHLHGTNMAVYLHGTNFLQYSRHVLL